MWNSCRQTLLAALAAAVLLSCGGSDVRVAEGVFGSGGETSAEGMDLDGIEQTGELIVLTRYGENTYYEWRGEGFGAQYLLATAYGRSVGVVVRVDVCHTDSELVARLRQGDGDVMFTSSLPDTVAEASPPEGLQRVDFRLGKSRCQWFVRQESSELEGSLLSWFDDHELDLLALSRPQLSDADGKTYVPRRQVSSVVRNAAKGEISIYDAHFKRYARQCGWDWRLLAAQAYQESGFDAKAVSWMGARGLMQLMPATARSVGVSGREFDPESSVQGATRLIAQLSKHYSGVRSADERINFVLAAYNAGAGHVDDARALAQKLGRNPDRWNEVGPIVLRMSESQYYSDPVVRHGYFRGSETYDYVNSIRSRWQSYKTKIKK